MNIKAMKYKAVLGALLLSLSIPVLALDVDITYFNPYRSPKPIQQNADDNGLSCAQLDREISRITPYTHNYRPDFDRDPYVGGAIIAGASYWIVGYGYLAFRFAGDFMEDKRIQTAEGKIEYLRRLKAEKYCYEDRG